MDLSDEERVGAGGREVAHPVRRAHLRRESDYEPLTDEKPTSTSTLQSHLIHASGASGQHRTETLIKSHQDWSNHTASGPEDDRSRTRCSVRICNVSQVTNLSQMRSPRQQKTHKVNSNAFKVTRHIRCAVRIWSTPQRNWSNHTDTAYLRRMDFCITRLCS